MAAKWLELLKEMVPSITRTAIILDPTNPSQAGFRATIRAAAVSLNVELTEIADNDPTEIERAVGAFAPNPNGGLLVFPGTYTSVNREVILAAAIRHRLPAIYPFRGFTETGGLLSYGVDSIELFRQGASYVNRILRGEKPADLPIQGPTKFELVVNLKTAKALGLTVPPSLLARADEVIE
jgi:putative ABC transport system substrate-binding protein